MLLREMSVSGQTQKSECATGKSASPSTTGIVSQTCKVGKVPNSEVGPAINSIASARAPELPLGSIDTPGAAYSP